MYKVLITTLVNAAGAMSPHGPVAVSIAVHTCVAEFNSAEEAENACKAVNYRIDGQAQLQPGQLPAGVIQVARKLF